MPRRSPEFGLAYFQIWLVLVGVVLILFTVSGLLFEYYIGAKSAIPLALGSPPRPGAVADLPLAGCGRPA